MLHKQIPASAGAARKTKTSRLCCEGARPVSWAKAGVGVVAARSFTNKSVGIRGSNLLRNGLTAQQALDSLLKEDEGREVRQVAVIDAKEM
ncbi:MAG TPA: DUF1028 domain-containing protein [Flavisolibacter sp.]|nr:DUF1028 domain-containing protein [Flavisolibacter sp.]